MDTERDESGQFTSDSNDSTAGESDETGEGSEDEAEPSPETDVQEVPFADVEDLDPLPAAVSDPTATPPEDASDIQQVIRGFVDGDLTFPDALDALAEALAAKYDIPWVPESLEERLLRALSELALRLIEEITQ